jgi:hypothetical protein
MCLLLVQQAEKALAFAVEEVLDHPDLKLMEQAESERLRTLGSFLRKLKRRVKLEPTLKDKLYHFLRMRNTLVHNLNEIPGWDGLGTEEGQQAALKFSVELAFASLNVTALFGELPRSMLN